MPVSPAREIAYRILRRVEPGRSFAVDLLQSGEVSELKDADRRLATELVMGVLRWRGELEFQIERLSGKPSERFDPEVRTILELGAYQIRFLEKIPKAAIVNEAVELIKAARKRSAGGLVNAVLRKCAPPAERMVTKQFEELAPEGREAVRRTVPAWMFERWATRDRAEGGEGREAGFDRALRLAWASTQVPPTTLRVAGVQGDREKTQAELAQERVKTQPGRYASRALVVESGNVQSSKAWREGWVVIQDEASQLVAELLAPEGGQRVLDLCAAPGIKAGQIAQALGRGTLVACDLSGSRLRSLRKLLPPQVPPAVRQAVVRLDATRELPFGIQFDRILLDAPCSGTGTLARNPEIRWRLRPSDLSRLAELQAKMLRNAFEWLAPGGRLVYATCSVEPEENEQVVERVLRDASRFQTLGARELARQFPALTGLFDARGYFRTRPDLDGMDGFFAAVIVRER